MLNRIIPSHMEIEESKIKVRPFIRSYYLESERENQFRSYSKIMNNTYKSKEELGYNIEEFIKESRYNLKLLRLEKKSNITYVCSCSSKGKHDNNNTDSLEVDTRNQQSSDNATYIGEINSSIARRERSVKRHNQESCKFRIKFEVEETGYIIFKGIQVHNHNPNQFEKVSLYILIDY